jgi:hypothetical protein
MTVRAKRAVRREQRAVFAADDAAESVNFARVPCAALCFLRERADDRLALLFQSNLPGPAKDAWLIDAIVFVVHPAIRWLKKPRVVVARLRPRDLYAGVTLLHFPHRLVDMTVELSLVRNDAVPVLGPFEGASGRATCSR